MALLTRTAVLQVELSITDTPPFHLLDVVASGAFPEDLAGLQGNSKLTYPIVHASGRKRSENSVEVIVAKCLAALRSQPLSRAALCESTGFQRRRLSSALSPFRGAGLIYLTAGTGPTGARLARDTRAETAAFAVSHFYRYFLFMQRLHATLEPLARGDPVDVLTARESLLARYRR
jgi:hypothetical protein